MKGITMMHRTHCGLGLAAALAVFASLAGTPQSAAAEPPTCAPEPQTDPLRLLRQASLDIRGRIPTFDELQAVRDAEDPELEVETRIDAMLVSDEWFDNVREYHRDLLWSSMEPAAVDRIIQAGRRMFSFVPNDGADDEPIWRVTALARSFRGNNTVRCVNELQTEFDNDGRPVVMNTYPDANCTGAGAAGTCSQEGYVLVEPYWAPGTEVKVCAFDAQSFEFGLTGDACAEYHLNDNGCGCGDNLELCAPTQDGMEGPFRDALAEEPLRIFENVVRSNLSYLEAFTTDLTWMNGTLAHYYRHQQGVLNINSVGTTYDPALGELPDLGYGQDAMWVPVQRESAHAGVLTTYGFVGRFASNRARANRFFTAFYCDPFVPPEDGLPPQEAEPNPNLRKRAGCDGCHEDLEPAAAHWGRWRTGGTYGLMRPELMSLEAPDESCLCGEGTETPNCSRNCSTYYVTADNSHPDEYAEFGGLPLATMWLEPGEQDAIEWGPSLLVETEPQQARIAQCMVSSMATHLLGRELGEDDLAWVDEHTQALIEDNYRFSGMVARLVADERYRSTR